MKCKTTVNRLTDMWNRSGPRQKGVTLRQAILAVWVLVGLGWGCVPKTDLFDRQSPLPPISETFDYRDWTTVLLENVKDGLIDYEHLADHAAPLDRFLDLVASVGPQSAPALFANHLDRTAYYVNTYNAGVLKAVLVAGVPETMHDVGGPQLDHDYSIRVDRQIRKLGDLRQAARLESEDNARIACDARIEFCFCDAAMGSSPIYRQAFQGQSLEHQLADVAEAAMNDPKMVWIDHDKQTLNLALVLRDHQEQFIAHRAGQIGTDGATMLSALLNLADGPRRAWLNRAVGYAISAIPFDRRLNAWTRGDS